jgi:nicotinate-nucleotide--dimethylbenzimidazole phosphoribosyltransferase
LKNIPVILDGYVACAGAAVLKRQDPAALDHCLLGHLSAEPAHRLLAEKLGLDPLLDLGMRLGEGSGASVAAMIVQAAVATHNGMATFAEAGVSEKSG